MSVWADEPPKKRLNLVFYFEGFATGGVTGVIDGLRHTLPASLKVGVVCSPDGRLREWRATLEKEGADVFPLALANRAGVLGWFEVFRLMKLVRLFRHARIIHFHQHTPFSCLPAILCGWLAGNRAMISTEHYVALLKFLRRRQLSFVLRGIREIRIRIQTWLKKLTLRAVHTLVLVSRANLETFQTFFARANIPRLTVIPNGVPVRRAGSDRTRARHRVRSLCGGGDFQHILITVAGLNNQKGHATLLEAAPLILAHFPSTAFLWIGDGHLRASLERRRDSSGLSNHVFLAGAHRDIGELLEGSDLFVLPSHFEGMPLSVLEAMAAGCAVVATAVDGTREVIQHETTGLLVPPDDPRSLAASIVRLLGNPSERAELARAGRQRVETEFTVQEMGSRYLHEYDLLLAPEGRRSS